MKINKSFIMWINRLVYFLIIILIWSCGSKKNNVNATNLKNKDSINYQYDSLRNIFNIHKFYKSASNNEAFLYESYVLNKNFKMVEYQFYNIFNSELIYTISYNEMGKIIAECGCPLYTGSYFFNNGVYSLDTFSVEIYLATPVSMSASIKIFKIDTLGQLHLQSEKSVKDDYSIVYIGNMDVPRRKFNYYCVKSKLLSNTYYREDEVYFMIKGCIDSTSQSYFCE